MANASPESEAPLTRDACGWRSSNMRRDLSSAGALLKQVFRHNDHLTYSDRGRAAWPLLYGEGWQCDFAIMIIESPGMTATINEQGIFHDDVCHRFCGTIAYIIAHYYIFF